MKIGRNCTLVPAELAVLILVITLSVTAQENKEFRYTVGPRALVSITNNYGPITVKPSGSKQVVVDTVSHSDAVGLLNEQRGDRIEVRSTSSRQGTGLVDYTVLLPADAFVSLRSSNGILNVRGLRNDVVLQAATGPVEVSDISDAHLHVRTLSGPITLMDIRNSHLDIRSVSGNIAIHNVSGPSVEVNSGRGRITYEGDPGPAGEYLLTSHSGDLDISIPATASVDIKAHSIRGQSDDDFPKAGNASTLSQRNLLMKPGTISKSRFELRSFSGKIHLKRP